MPPASRLSADVTAQPVTLAERPDAPKGSPPRRVWRQYDRNRADGVRRHPHRILANFLPLLPLCLTGCWSGHSSDTFSFGVDAAYRLADNASIERGIADDINSHLGNRHLGAGAAVSISCPGSDMRVGQTYLCAGTGFGMRGTVEVQMESNRGDYTWRVLRDS